MAKTQLYTKAHLTEAECFAFLKGEVAVISARCPGEERDNEDSAAVIPYTEDSGVLIVADGCGGHPGGDQASSIIVEQLKKEIKKRGKTPLRGRVLDGIENANAQIVKMGSGSASTLAIVEINGQSVRTYHVGDSAVLIIGQQGKLKLQTMAHSPVGYAQEAGMLDEEQAIHHEERHVVSNLMGMVDTRIEMGMPIDLAKNDTLVMASDGLFDNLTSEEIIEHIRKGPLQLSTQLLADTCGARMLNPTEDHPSKPDDLTMIVFRLL